MENSLPNNWVETELGNYIYLKNGYAYKSKQFRTEGIPILKISNITKDGKISLSNIQFIDKKDFTNNFLINKGDILIAMSGATTGKFGIYEEEDLILQNQRVGNLKLYSENLGNKKFVYYLLGFLKKEIEDRAYGGAQPNISSTLIETIKIPLPPLPEQERIVAKLDALFAQHEAMKKALERIPQLLKDFREQVLTQAVTGKLTEKWRKEEKLKKVDLVHIEKLREKYKKDFFILNKGKKFTYKPAKKVQLHENTKGISDLFEIPNSWEWINLDHVVWNISDGPHFSPNYMDKQEGKRFISMRNITFDDINFDDCKFVSESDHTNFIKRGKPEKGDLLYTKGGTTGIPCVIKDDNDFSYWVHVALLKLIPEVIDSFFLRNVLASSFCYNQAKAFTHGVGNQDLGLTRMVFITFPLPNIVEQQEIASKVESLFAKADIIEKRYKILKEKIDSLPQAILHKAFKGELVPQLPTDGDAKDLLDEILKLKKEVKKK
ncbi:restriction endonuclease subunit S [uncultured Flavobacterium sp.]|uniref:restriction endonuclease subunit S n=1 Tax=uncultured Flavobacterium sp. TaxID=165435 RepID=UPI0027DFFE55|nr:restriction endonuclease subunit S [uncultured Flavobacterium sp.]